MSECNIHSSPLNKFYKTDLMYLYKSNFGCILYNIIYIIFVESNLNNGCLNIKLNNGLEFTLCNGYFRVLTQKMSINNLLNAHFNAQYIKDIYK